MGGSVGGCASQSGRWRGTWFSTWGCICLTESNTVGEAASGNGVSAPSGRLQSEAVGGAQAGL